MRFQGTPLAGVKVIDTAPHTDTRGSFRRLWCSREFSAENVPRPIVQASLSETARRGTLRGLHFQLPPSREDKLVQCVSGCIFDVALDLRPDSASYLAHVGVELSGTNGRALFIPAGCAHGFLTLTDNCAVLYMMTDYYDPALSTGVRWNDPRFAIQWPEQPKEILPRDAEYPDFDDTMAARFARY